MDEDSTLMKSVVFGSIVLGFLLLVASSLWSTLFPATSSWTPEKGTRWGQVKDRLNTLTYIVHRPPSMHRGSDLGPLKAEYEQLKQEHEQLKAEFESAASRPNTISKILKWSGISLAIVGIVGWYAVKDS
jgi:hypothetical protein